MPSEDRSCLATVGVRDREVPRQLVAQLASEVGHGGKVRDAAAIDPLEDLPAVKARDTRGREELLELVELELGRVDTNGGSHGMLGNLPL